MFVWIRLMKCFFSEIVHFYKSLFQVVNTTWKVSKYGVISGLYFPVFGLNMERKRVSFRIQSEHRKIRTRNNSVFGHFSRSDWYVGLLFLHLLQVLSLSPLRKYNLPFFITMTLKIFT